MDAMVSARIGIEKRDKGNEILKRIGATPTQLINAAYDYLLEVGKLPDARSETSRKRKLDEHELAALRESIAATTMEVPAEYFGGKTDKELLADALRGKYGTVGSE